MNDLFLGLSVFLAAAVEWVEALTIALALGITRSWRSALLGAGSALISLAVVVAIFGRVLANLGSDESSSWLRHLWLIAGTLLLIVGVQWMRKAILRAGGVLSKRDEDKVYKRVSTEARQATSVRRGDMDWYSYAVVFKSVLLEGFEVVFIVTAFGIAQQNLGLGVVAALVALVVVALLGLVLHRPLARVPENGMKLFVGVMLTTFGTYFATMGVGVTWPHGEVSVIGILLFNIALSLVLLRLAQGSVSGAARRATD